MLITHFVINRFLLMKFAYEDNFNVYHMAISNIFNFVTDNYFMTKNK